MATGLSQTTARALPTVTVDAPAIVEQYAELLREDALLRGALSESNAQPTPRRGFAVVDAFASLFKRPQLAAPSPLERFAAADFYSTTLIQLGVTAALAAGAPPDVLSASRDQALAAIRARGIAQPASSRERAERFVALDAAIRGKNPIDDVTRAWNTLSSAEQKSLAPVVLHSVFADDETPRGLTHVVVQRAQQLYAELHSLAGAPPIEPVAPSCLARADFGTKMDTFERALARSIGGDTLYEAANALHVSHRLDHTWGLYSTHTHIVETDHEIVWSNSHPADRVTANRGCNPAAIGEALGVTRLADASALERAGFAAIARRFLTVVDAARVASHRTRAALESVIACDDVDAQTRSHATKLCAMQALDRLGGSSAKLLYTKYAESVKASYPASR